ncbi:MAG: DotU family type IV/VI secretion system protein [Planctomycetes bacterium]|nr:DotU family type IV/VI secretion system protein [Planctomycetota bacterium]
MTPEFAAAIDPVFLHVLGVLDRISRNESLSAPEEHNAVMNWLRQAEGQLGQRTDWELAKFAMVAWIDDMLIEAPWDGRLWWKENALEVEIFNTRERATRFYTMAQDASRLTRRDALEVFYVCVVLGFRGLYRDSQAALLASQLNLPPDLDSWARQTARSIQLGQGRPPIDEKPRPPGEAAPLEGKFLLLGSSVICTVLAVFAALLGWLLFFT